MKDISIYTLHYNAFKYSEQVTSRSILLFHADLSRRKVRIYSEERRGLRAKDMTTYR